MSMHTPGPWRVLGSETYNDGDAIPVFPVVGGVCICEVIARDGMGLSNMRTQVMAETNALLIAAAPEMYEALKDALSQIDYLRRKLSDKKRRLVAPTANACEEKIFTAIAKAEGR